MKVEYVHGEIVIKGSRGYFSFLVDGDKSCWSKYFDQARRYLLEESAAEDLRELKRRRTQWNR
jgi:hypothetical protein